MYLSIKEAERKMHMKMLDMIKEFNKYVNAYMKNGYIQILTNSILDKYLIGQVVLLKDDKCIKLTLSNNDAGYPECRKFTLMKHEAKLANEEEYSKLLLGNEPECFDDAGEVATWYSICNEKYITDNEDEFKSILKKRKMRKIAMLGSNTKQLHGHACKIVLPYVKRQTGKRCKVEDISYVEKTKTENHTCYYIYLRNGYRVCMQ